jgi:hypothetical protein
MKVGIIVDGPGDLLSLKTKYPGEFKILKTDGPRGHSARARDIIGRSKKQVLMLKALSCKKIILMLDFEARSCNYEDFISELEDEIHNFNLGIECLCSIPNQMIENWYLADIEFLSKKKMFLKDNLKQKNYEGSNGKEALKKLFKKEYSYNETIHGPQLFLEIREYIAQKNSLSFKKFLDLIHK